ncbi:unnamed protein product [Phyllotreta striolata]|uniref:FLYWCH-type domain-containing protein n=1 Tax=Phyllotreta striolata TaxID=444603 RepID=A0A9P0GTI4_PHYSR|nr:unnamed protein product [Phyllotreta striolata]
METMLSERGKLILVYKNYKYYVGRVLKRTGENSWRCFKKRCKAQIYTLGGREEPIFSRTSGTHNHDSDSEAVLNRQKISNTVKRKATDDTSDRPSKIINREVSENVLRSITVKDIKYIRDNFNREKKIKKCATNTP